MQVPPAAAPAAYDVFTDLDPLGTGRSKPYVDKKLFFQELKNPPKKVLKDLVPSHSLLPEIMAPEPKPDSYRAPTTMTSLSRHSGGSVAIAKPAHSNFSSNFFTSDPFAETDPFDNTDPFSDTFKDDPFTSMQDFPKISSLRTEDPRGKPVHDKPEPAASLHDFPRISSLRTDDLKSKLMKEFLRDKPETSSESGKNVFNGPLQVTLPPEPAPKSPRLSRQVTRS